MIYEFIISDKSVRISDDELKFVSNLQKFIESNFTGSKVAKVSISEDFIPSFEVDLPKDSKLNSIN